MRPRFSRPPALLARLTALSINGKAAQARTLQALQSFPQITCAPERGRWAMLPSTQRPMLASSMHSSAMAQRSAGESDQGVVVLDDGECPLCMHEINWLRKRNHARGDVRMTFTDISLPGYDPAHNAGVSYEEGMKVMHVIKGGQIFSGVESFQIMYEAVGLGWVVKSLRIPAAKRVADRIYNVWARLRLPMSGRPSLEVLLERRAAQDATCATKVSKDCRF